MDVMCYLTLMTLCLSLGLTYGQSSTCSYDGRDYTSGETFSSTVLCNTCTCEDDGSVSCTDITCKGCLSATGKIIPHNGLSDKEDECNTCQCQNGQFACTLMACLKSSGYEPSSSFLLSLVLVSVVVFVTCKTKHFMII